MKSCKLSQADIRNLYWIFIERLDTCDEIVRGFCDDIDCKKFGYREELKKSCRCDIINHKGCVIKAKTEKEVLLKLLFEKRFRKYRFKPCCVCKKPLDSLDDEDYVLKTTRGELKSFGKFGEGREMLFFSMHKKCKKKWKVP